VVTTNSLPVYRVVKKKKGWVVQIKGKWLWKTHYPFGCKDLQYYDSELNARHGANRCRRVDERR
jgi:hypothetical protein